MNDSQFQTIAEVKKFLESCTPLAFKGKRRQEVYEWIEDTLIKFSYKLLKKKEKGVIRQYIKKMTGYSRAQMNRLILQYTTKGTVEMVEYERHTFSTIYSSSDIALLAKTDELHEFPNGAAIKKVLERMFKLYGRVEYRKISEISVAHIYNLRRSPSYLRITKRYEKTKPHVVNIGNRKKPNPNGKPGFLRVDTVHQGDREDGIKGVYHIHFVDEVTQYEYVVAVEKITERYLLPAIEKILRLCPFEILGFHADNGSEYINQKVAILMNKTLIEFTKSRARHSNDNALVEGKNGAVIRKWMGYGFIEQKYAKDINNFYFSIFHEYLNFHRTSGFATDIEDKKKKGRIKKLYYYKDYQTPYEKLKSLPNSKTYLKKDVTFEELDKIALRYTDNQIAEEVQKKRYKLFSKIFQPAYSSQMLR